MLTRDEPDPTTVASVEVSVVIVSFNVQNLLLRCLASLDKALGSLSHEILVVDNASTDGSPAAVKHLHPGVSVTESRVNRGFSAANNLGMSAASGSFLLLLNPDTEVEVSSITSMLAFLKAHPDVGIVGPKLIKPDGSIQSSRRRFPSLATAVIESTIVQRWWPRSRLLDSYYVADRPNVTQDVDWLVGACLLVRRSVIDAIGGFDERFFMYSEELDLCRRAREAGWRIAYVADAEVVHHEGRSSEQNVVQRSLIFNESKASYFEKYRGHSVGQALRFVLLGSTAVDLLGEALKLLLRHRPELRERRVANLSRIALGQLRLLCGADPSISGVERAIRHRHHSLLRDAEPLG